MVVGIVLAPRDNRYNSEVFPAALSEWECTWAASVAGLDSSPAARSLPGDGSVGHNVLVRVVRSAFHFPWVGMVFVGVSALLWAAAYLVPVPHYVDNSNVWLVLAVPGLSIVFAIGSFFVTLVGLASRPRWAAVLALGLSVALSVVITVTILYALPYAVI